MTMLEMIMELARDWDVSIRQRDGEFSLTLWRDEEGLEYLGVDAGAVVSRAYAGERPDRTHKY